MSSDSDDDLSDDLCVRVADESDARELELSRIKVQCTTLRKQFEGSGLELPQVPTTKERPVWQEYLKTMQCAVEQLSNLKRLISQLKKEIEVKDPNGKIPPGPQVANKVVAEWRAYFSLLQEWCGKIEDKGPYWKMQTFSRKLGQERGMATHSRSRDQIVDPLDYLAKMGGDSHWEKISNAPHFDFVDVASTDDENVADNLQHIVSLFQKSGDTEALSQSFVGELLLHDCALLRTLYGDACRKCIYNFHLYKPTSWAVVFRNQAGAPFIHQDWNLMKNELVDGIEPLNIWRILNNHPSEPSSLALFKELDHRQDSDGIVELGTPIARIVGDSAKNPYAFIFNPLRCWHVAVHTTNGEKLRRSVETRIFMVHRKLYDDIVKAVEASAPVDSLSATSRALWAEFTADEPSFNAHVHENYSQRKSIVLKEREGWSELYAMAKQALSEEKCLLDAWKFMFSDPSLMFEPKLTRSDVNSTGEQWISPNGEKIMSNNFQVQGLGGGNKGLSVLPFL